MATSKGKKGKAPAAKGSKQIQAEGKLAIKGFNRAGMLKQLLAMGASREAEESAAQARNNASLAVCEHAWIVRQKCEAAGIPAETAAKGFVTKWDGLLPELVKQGSPFVTVTEKADGSKIYKTTGHANNVKSIAKGVIEEGINPAECLSKQDQKPSYREVKQQVQDARAKGRPPEERQLVEARALLSEAIKEFRKVGNHRIDPDHIIMAVGYLETATAAVKDALAKQADLDAKAAELQKQAEAIAGGEDEDEDDDYDMDVLDMEDDSGEEDEDAAKAA